MKDYQQRMMDEATELKKKCVALEVFLETDAYEELALVEQAKLSTQAYFMVMYLLVLEDRILDFTEGEQDE